MQQAITQALLDQDLLYHVVFPTYARIPIFKNDLVKGEVIELFEETLVYCSIDVIIYNILSDHVHLLVHKHIHQSIPDLVKSLKGRSTYYFYKSNPDFKVDLGRGRLWAKGYYSTEIKSINQLENTIFYIYNNNDRHVD